MTRRIASTNQGRGIAARACRALVGYAFSELGLNRVEIWCSADNQKGRSVPERLGFTLDGLLRKGGRVHDRFVDVAL